jgi:hypothetical protein
LCKASKTAFSKQPLFDRNAPKIGISAPKLRNSEVFPLVDIKQQDERSFPSKYSLFFKMIKAD